MGNWLVRDLFYPRLGGKTTGNNHFSGMEEAFLRFPHLPEQIFEILDNESLANLRSTAISWRNFVDDREYPLNRFKSIAMRKFRYWDINLVGGILVS